MDAMMNENAMLVAPRPSSLPVEAAVANNNNNLPPKIGRRKKRRATEPTHFHDIYEETGEQLGRGSCGNVRTFRKKSDGKEFAVKMINTSSADHDHLRQKILKEIEIFHYGQGCDYILHMVEYFEEDDVFYVVFDKMRGGTLLENIGRRGHLTEREASVVVKQIATALNYLHKRGIAHRDLKPENVLCEREGELVPIRICDFDLGSDVIVNKSSNNTTPVTTPEMQTPVGSAEFMAPEVVDVWQEQAWSYDKKCDLWSLGIILYIMLCGYPPFYGQCGKDCGWEKGEYCQACQDQLFHKIQEGKFDFPLDEWSDVSESAKDLIRHLLVRDPHQRYSAAQVLRDPWVCRLADNTQQLATPTILHRNNSIKELEQFAENAVAFNRLMLQHLSISEVSQPPVFSLGDFEDDDGEDADDAEKTTLPDDEPPCSLPDEAPILWMAKSPHGQCGLAQQRLSKDEPRRLDERDRCIEAGNP